MSDGGDPMGGPRARLDAAMRRLAAGERNALADVYQATHTKLFGIALRILQDRGDAEDAVQEVYVALWQKAKRYDPTRASAIAWLVTAARNRAIDALRRRRGNGPPRPIEDAGDVPDPSPRADAQLVDAERQARIHLCLGRLEPAQGDAIRAAFLSGHTYLDLAQRQDVPLGTMKSRIRRGLARLKTCLEADA